MTSGGVYYFSNIIKNVFYSQQQVQEIDSYYKSRSAAVPTDWWYKYIAILGVSTSNISHDQLQYALIDGIIIYLHQAFRLLI